MSVWSSDWGVAEHLWLSVLDAHCLKKWKINDTFRHCSRTLRKQCWCFFCTMINGFTCSWVKLFLSLFSHSIITITVPFHLFFPKMAVPNTFLEGTHSLSNFSLYFECTTVKQVILSTAHVIKDFWDVFKSNTPFRLETVIQRYE